MQLGSVLLWTGCGPAAASPIRPLYWELPYDAGAAPKRQKKKKKKKLKTKMKERKKQTINNSFLILIRCQKTTLCNI